jgi:biopolymer transport protein ExbD
MKLGISSKKISTTVLISMTDVIFLLLLFLLIASNFSSQTGVPFKLPGSQSRNRQTLQVLQIVYVDDANITFKDKPYTLASLAPVLKREFKSPEQVVRLSAPKEASLQSVITVMDAIRGAGFEKIFVATIPVGAEK